MTYVLVHGATFDGRCWEPLLPYLDADAVAVDLPGRGSRPADLSLIAINDFVDAVVDEIVSRDLHDVQLVGHSLAGITLPGVAARIPDRLARLVFVGATVPAHGQTVMDALNAAVRELADDNAAEGTVIAPEDWARRLFCNDMDETQTKWTLEHMVNEAPGVMTEPVDLRGLENEVARSWVLPLRDAIVVPDDQRRYAERVAADVNEIDAAHMVMISQPRELARVLGVLRAISTGIGT